MSDQTPYTPSLDEVREHFAHVPGWRVDPEAQERHDDREAMFDRLIAQVRAETWDKGYVSGWIHGRGTELSEHEYRHPSNPYREEQ